MDALCSFCRNYDAVYAYDVDPPRVACEDCRGRVASGYRDELEDEATRADLLDLAMSGELEGLTHSQHQQLERRVRTRLRGDPGQLLGHAPLSHAEHHPDMTGCPFTGCQRKRRGAARVAAAVRHRDDGLHGPPPRPSRSGLVRGRGTRPTARCGMSRRLPEPPCRRIKMVDYLNHLAAAATPSSPVTTTEGTS